MVKSFKRWVKIVVEFAQDLLVPEDLKIQKLLNLPAHTMRDLLPKSPVYSKDIFVLFDYQNKVVRLIVKAIKYKNNANLRKRVAGYLYEEIIDLASEIALWDGAPPLLVPMPMSKKEKKNRTFNQCEELVREIKKIGDLPAQAGENILVSYNTLKKVRETERQTKLSREKRMENVRDSMCAFLKSEATIKTQHPERSEGKYLPKYKTIIVLDDVYTTGASLSEARRALLASGASRVIGLFIAH